MEKVSTPGLDYSFYVVLVRVVNGICIPDHPVSGWTMNLCSIARLKSWGQITVVINDGSWFWNSCEKHERLLSKRNEACEEGTLFNKFKNCE